MTTDYQPLNYFAISQFIVGDIACLKDYNWGRTVEEKREISGLNPGHNMEKASNHPCIVLKTNRKYALVTTVSAHGSGPYDNWRSPWTRGGHYRQRRDRYRSFQGTARFNLNRKSLRLATGAWPKPRGSWVNAEHVFLVPVWFLGVFKKAQSYDRYQKKLVNAHMAEDSLDDLLQQIIEDNWQWTRLLQEFEELGRLEPLPPPSHPPAPVALPPRAPAKASPLPRPATTTKASPPPALTKPLPSPRNSVSWAQVAKGKKR
ncbi:hypothetical protein SMACR_05239 [Sordaria macrospora]|uniref:WGS project CABT00000000 data, contig 2.8 n=2 Tax=Sordaria macrospora TaxID=5147 RepID=F7VV00_SORMK|nr:uncharacterized protein SMAC_05239 [Sordaria macrospora k-hell]KAA8632674.1 hypothetical protein SMACR_05239 [Sordaria macrospora]KAH7628724.1 hypothetical protein B0T09DRAFT_267719 [Sordaria sp. MPI-SDFR-AT-0083]WPJ57353.1 hypothetical protein SMAC4_05239 [Sordaria macrospora]CCC09346.1 unnamed protein product [Sordaria macrospora k-hell]